MARTIILEIAKKNYQKTIFSRYGKDGTTLSEFFLHSDVQETSFLYMWEYNMNVCRKNSYKNVILALFTGRYIVSTKLM